MNMTRGALFVSTCMALSLGAKLHAEAAPSVAWTRQIGTMSTDISNSVAVDAAGNAYISGHTYGSLGGTNAGDIDAFLSKFDPSGNELWTRQIGTTSSDVSNSVALDAAGNAYISGYTDGSLGGPNAGGADAFLTKFDPSGTELWTRQIGTGQTDGSRSVAVDAVGNVYISGETSGILGGPWLGYNDAFLIKYDPTGTELWSKQFGTSSGEISTSVAVDSSGNTYVSGYTKGNLGGTNAGSADAFLTKFDPSGEESWSRLIGTVYRDQSHAVAVDGAGHIYISGYSANGPSVPTGVETDAFLTKFDPSGVQLWSQKIGTAVLDQSNSVAVDDNGNVYLSGETTGSLGALNVGGYDAFLTKFDSSGEVLWSQQIGTMEDDKSRSVVVDGNGNAYISGWTDGSLGEHRVGAIDAFLIKFAIPEPASLALLALGAPALLRRR